MADLPEPPQGAIDKKIKANLCPQSLCEIGELSAIYLKPEASEFSEEDLVDNLRELCSMAEAENPLVSKRHAARLRKLALEANILADFKNERTSAPDVSKSGKGKFMSFGKYLKHPWSSIRERGENSRRALAADIGALALRSRTADFELTKAYSKNGDEQFKAFLEIARKYGGIAASSLNMGNEIIRSAVKDEGNRNPENFLKEPIKDGKFLTLLAKAIKLENKQLAADIATIMPIRLMEKIDDERAWKVCLEAKTRLPFISAVGMDDLAVGFERKAYFRRHGTLNRKGAEAFSIKAAQLFSAAVKSYVKMGAWGAVIGCSENARSLIDDAMMFTDGRGSGLSKAAGSLKITLAAAHKRAMKELADKQRERRATTGKEESAPILFVETKNLAELKFTIIMENAANGSLDAIGRLGKEDVEALKEIVDREFNFGEGRHDKGLLQEVWGALLERSAQLEKLERK